MSDTYTKFGGTLDIDIIKQCAKIQAYLAERVPDLELNDICYAFDVLCFLLSDSDGDNNFASQSHITNRTIDRKIDLLHHAARFAFNLDLDKVTYQRLGLRYIELLDFSTKIMKDMSIKDSLTGALCFDYLKSLNERLSQQNFLLFFFDLDNLKAVNDTQGHEAGNQVLKTFANALLESLRAADLVFRYGGDEFVVIVLNEHIEPNVLIERIDYQLHSKTQASTIQYSVGWAYNEEFDLFKTIKVADSLMYKNKRRLI